MNSYAVSLALAPCNFPIAYHIEYSPAVSACVAFTCAVVNVCTIFECIMRSYINICTNKTFFAPAKYHSAHTHGAAIQITLREKTFLIYHIPYITCTYIHTRMQK